MSDDIKEVLESKKNSFSSTLEIEKTFLKQYCYDAISLEGRNAITFEGVSLIIDGKQPKEYSKKEIDEVSNHQKCYYEIKKMVADKIDLTEEKLKDLHELLLDGISNSFGYRNVNIQIFSATHQPPDYVKVYERMNRLFNDLQNYEGIEQAVYVHAIIAKVHPFLDGNGRISRLILNYYLMRLGFLPVSIPIDKRTEYFKALEVFKSEKRLDMLTSFVGRLLLERYEEII